MSTTISYCRFCANEKSQKSLINLRKTNKLQNCIKEKLGIFSEKIVDFNKKDMPESICTACNDALNKSYEFFVHAKESQVVLSILCHNSLNAGQVSVEPEELVPVKQELDNLELDSWVEDSELDIPDDSWISYSWQCLHCKLILPHMQDLRIHNQKCHGVCNGFRCTDCNEQRVGFDQFVEHVRVHRPALRNYCQYCNIKIDTPAHVDTHTYVCNCCGQPFTHKKHLLTHLQKYKPFITDNAELKIEYSDAKSNGACKETIKLENDHVKETIGNSVNDDDNDLNDIPPPPLYDTMLKRNIEIADIRPSLSKIKNLNTKNDQNLSTFRKINAVNVPSLVPITKKVVKQESKVDKKLQVWSDYPCICKYCDLSVPNWGMLKTHCLSYHQKCFGMQCIDCDKDESESWDEFAHHVITHRPNFINNCHYCHAPIADSDQFYSLHIQSHKTRYQCSSCGQQFKSMRDLRNHDNKLNPHLLKPPNKRNTNPIRDEDVICNVCCFRAKSPWFLNKHKTIHSDRKRDFTCERCGKTFMTKGSLDYHTKMHELHETEPKEICKVCGKAFYTVNKLKEHVKCHNLVLPYQCDDCKKFFRSRNSLRSHVIIHLNVKPFACNYCPKRFNRKKLMQNHEYQHTGARPFSCDICCLNFTCWSNCDKHLRRIHGTSLAKGIVTPYGKLDIDPETGKPRELSITNDVKEWTKSLIGVKNKSGRKKKEIPVS